MSDYDALQVKLEKRFSNGLSLLASYAWSKTLTDGGSMFSTFSSDFGTTDPWNRDTQKTYSFEDIPNLASIAYVYDLPVGKGQHFMNRGGVANAILGGWKYSGILRYMSGFPRKLKASTRRVAWKTMGGSRQIGSTGFPWLRQPILPAKGTSIPLPIACSTLPPLLNRPIGRSEP